MKVNGMEFNSQTEYLAALRDRNRIEAIKRRANISRPETAKTILERVKAQPGFFETAVGAEFVKELAKNAGVSSSGKKIIKNRVDHSEELEKLELERENTTKASEAKTEAPKRRKVELYKEDAPLVEPEIEEPVEKKRMNRNRKLALVLTGISAAMVFALFLGKEIGSRIEDYNSAQKIKELQNIVQQSGNRTTKRNNGVINASASEGENKGEEDETPVDITETQEKTVLPEYSTIYERNHDLVGWIQIPGTSVNYPVMQTKEDMEYYLLRDFDGNSDKNGLPFVDARSDVFDRTTNVLIYGHCMKSGSMFAGLLNYKDKNYYLEHPIIYFDTIYERAEYEIIAAFQSKVALVGEEMFRYYSFIDTDSEDEFNYFIYNIKKLSYYETGISAEYGDELITLSTCDREITNGRMVIVARKIK